MNRWLVIFTWLTISAHADAPWSWLNTELGAVEQEHGPLRSALITLPPSPTAQPHEHAGFHSGFAPQQDSIRWVQIDLGKEYALDEVVVIPAMLGSVEAYGFPHRFRVDASNDSLFGESITLLDQTSSDVSSTLAPWRIDAKKAKARYVRFAATKLSSQPRLSQRFIFCLGELLVFSGGQNIALQANVLAPNSVETLPTWSPKHLVDGCHALGLPVNNDDVSSNGWHSDISTTADATKWVQVDLGSVRDLQEIRLIPAHPRDYPDRFGFGFPHRFKVEADGRTIFDSSTTDFPNPSDTPVAFPTPRLRAKTIRITATKLWERSGDFVYALAELQAFSGGKNIALGSSATSSDDTLTTSWQREFLVDGRSSSGLLLHEAAWLSDLSKRREISHELAELDLRHNAGVSLAQMRAAWLGGFALLSVVAFAFIVIQRSKRSRHLEMESLRQRISRDLHDDIGSHLGSIRLMSELALRDGSDSDSLEEIHRLAGEAAESMRGIIWLVREGDAPKLASLVEAMSQSAASLLKGTDWTLKAPTADDSTTASLEFHRQVFLFFREAAHNVTRHAKASTVTIEICWKSKRFQLCIKDNGCGFDADAVTAGNGLTNLRHRAEVLKGNLHITSESGKGTHITLDAPLS
ncbi:MAG: discoidin domain-containing protein [Prosthecobacter sp.]